ncbi:hypothetical protein LOAG_02578 [Loa loa]|uniref:Uncharacterized protein n=1 Tax=Loa loa TaxID=7209 RepID=A0A1S0U773_LOALO|nr:hypothetical protein LOAG_02578 [Loa loa]EFO25907.1 hypothetical protein LOAG_02578 [Loa loa]
MWCSSVMAVRKRSSGGGSTPHEWDPETWFGSLVGGGLISQLDAGAPENGHRHCDDNGPTPTNDGRLTGVFGTHHDNDDNARPNQQASDRIDLTLVPPPLSSFLCCANRRQVRRLGGTSAICFL